MRPPIPNLPVASKEPDPLPPTSQDSESSSDATICLKARRGGEPSASDTAIPSDQGGGFKEDRPGPAHFEICGELGRGGMGIVFDAKDPRFQREVAIKVMAFATPMNSEQVARFITEARIQGQLEHPGICPVHEFGIDDRGRPWFAMKKVRGRSLRGILRAAATSHENGDQPAFGLMRLLDVFARVCEAVAFAHARGVVHRDLKPANIMVGEFGEVLVMDWGLSCFLLPSEAQFSEEDDSALGIPDCELPLERGVVVGTPSYMSPEQAAGRLYAVEERGDVYSLGAVLYHILTSTPAVRAESRSETLMRVRKGDFPSPSKRAPGRQIPVALDLIVMKAMAKEPADRHQSVTQLMDEIDSWRSDQLGKSAFCRAMQRAWDWLRRS